jgi:hypothetical protein
MSWVTLVFVDVVSKVGATMRRFAGFVVTVTIIATLFYLMLKFISNYRRNRLISEEHNKMLSAGRLSAKALKLRFLFTSDDNKKLINNGKISAFVRIKPEHGEDVKEWHVFAVKKGMFGEYRFFKTAPDRHSKLFTDVTLYDWNFVMDTQNKFFIINRHTLPDARVIKMSNEAGVDSIGLLSPVIMKAVQVNPIHRIQLRMTKLIKVPDENLTSSLQAVSMYLAGQGQT